MASNDKDKTSRIETGAAPGGRMFADASDMPAFGRDAAPFPVDDCMRPGSRPSPYSSYLGSPDTHIGATQPIAIRKGLFDGISVAQVIAASAAAATSMLLASKIGIAGSVIGAAVSSMVTVICSQLYRNALDASAQKLKAKQAYNAQVHGPQGAPDARIARRAGAADAQVRDGVLTARIAPTKLQARAAAERSASKRKVAIASTLIAILAVALSAGAIMLSTSGEGLGTKTPPIFTSAAPAEQPPANPADEVAPTDDPAAKGPSDETPAGTGDAAPDTAGKDDAATQKPDADGAAKPDNPVGDSDSGASSGSNDASAQTPDGGTGSTDGNGQANSKGESAPSAQPGTSA